MSSPPIQWYPGHIAKAEKALKEQLKRVDVVLEVLDARIPNASHHPQILDWIGSKPRLIILNRMDMIPESAQKAWLESFKIAKETVYFTNAKTGTGIKAVIKAAQSVGMEVNKRRSERGMLPRPVRAVVIGFPNVGKSALINRLVGRKVVASERRAGVTRQLQWVRISEIIELLDAPGVIPWRLENQNDAVKLAICQDIGEAAYDNQRVAACLVDLLIELEQGNRLESRYKIPLESFNGEDYLQNLADLRYRGDKEKTALVLLNDFRTQNLGAIALEIPNILKERVL